MTCRVIHLDLAITCVSCIAFLLFRSRIIRVDRVRQMKNAEKAIIIRQNPKRPRSKRVLCKLFMF
jgi:hypothetical protein